MVRETLRQGQAFMGGCPETNTNSNSADDGSKSQAGRNHRVADEAVVNPAPPENKVGGGSVLPRPKQGNPYLPTGVPRNPRYNKAEARWPSSPNSAVGVVGVPLWSALLSKLDDDTMVRISVPVHTDWAGMYEPCTHEAFSIESVQGILGILSYEWSTLAQIVARDNVTTYATIFKFNKPKP